MQVASFSHIRQTLEIININNDDVSKVISFNLDGVITPGHRQNDVYIKLYTLKSNHYLLQVQEFNPRIDIANVKWFCLIYNEKQASLIKKEIPCSMMLAVQKTFDNSKYFCCMDNSVLPSIKNQLFYLVEFVFDSDNINANIIEKFSSINNLFPLVPSIKGKKINHNLHQCLGNNDCKCQIVNDSIAVNAEKYHDYTFFSQGKLLVNNVTKETESFDDLDVHPENEFIYLVKIPHKLLIDYGNDGRVTRICLDSSKTRQVVHLPEHLKSGRLYFGETKRDFLVLTVHQLIMTEYDLPCMDKELETILLLDFFSETCRVIKPTSEIERNYYVNYLPNSFTIDNFLQEEEFSNLAKDVLSNYLLKELVSIILIF
jgi:hypothetical protein